MARDEERRQLLERRERRVSDDGHARRERGAHTVEERIRARHLCQRPAEQHQRRRVRRDEVDDEDVPAPRRRHVRVREGGGAGVRPRALGAQRAAPAVEGGDERRDGDALVVKAAADRALQVRRHDRHHERRRRRRRRPTVPAHSRASAPVSTVASTPNHAGTWRSTRRRATSPRRNAGEQRVHRRGAQVHRRVDGRADRTAERIPRRVVEPREEFRDAVLDQVLARGRGKWNHGSNSWITLPYSRIAWTRKS